MERGRDIGVGGGEGFRWGRGRRYEAVREGGLLAWPVVSFVSPKKRNKGHTLHSGPVPSGERARIGSRDVASTRSFGTSWGVGRLGRG